MKKMLSILLALSLLFCLFALMGCESEEAGEELNEQSSQGTTPPENGEDSGEEEMTMQERLDAGEHPLIGMVVNGLDDSMIKMEAEFLEEELEALGFEFSVQSCEGVNTTAIEQIENFVTMGAIHIIMMPREADPFESVVVSAMEQGVQITFMGLPEPENYAPSGGSAVKWSDVGNLTAEMAFAWIDEVYPDAGPGNEVHVAFALFSSTSFFKTMMEDVMELFENDPRTIVAFTKDNVRGIDPSFTFAEEALTADPEIRVFIGWQDNCGIGASNYVMSQPYLDPAEFAAFATGYSADTDAIVEMAKTNESCYRGSTAYGATDVNANPAQGILDVVKALVFGEKEAPFWNYDTIWTIDSFGFNGRIEY